MLTLVTAGVSVQSILTLVTAGVRVQSMLADCADCCRGKDSHQSLQLMLSQLKKACVFLLLLFVCFLFVFLLLFYQRRKRKTGILTTSENRWQIENKNKLTAFLRRLHVAANDRRQNSSLLL